jgi:hypothetical protein
MVRWMSTYWEKRPFELVTTFDNPPEIYFMDHMAPFRGIIAENRRQSRNASGKMITSLFRENPSKKFLAATSGV